MANYEHSTVDAQTPERVLSVVDLEYESGECILRITEMKQRPLHFGFQNNSISSEPQQTLDNMSCGKINVDLFRAEEAETKLTASCETTKTGSLSVPVKIPNSPNPKANNSRSSTTFKYSQKDQHPHVRRSHKNIKLNDPQAFNSLSAGLLHETPCADSMGEPLIHSKQHFIRIVAENAVNLRCEQGNFKISHGDQEVCNLAKESKTLPAQYLVSSKETSLAILPENGTNSKDVNEKGHQKKNCFQKLLELFFISKNKQKTVKSNYICPQASSYPVLPTPALTDTKTKNEISVSKYSEKDT